MIGRLRPIRENIWYGSMAGLLIFATAFLLHDVSGRIMEQAPSIRFYPAILTATLVGGLRIGAMVAGLCFTAAWSFVLPPDSAWTLRDEAEAVALALSWMLAALQLYIIHTLNRAVDALTAERNRAGALFRELEHCVTNTMMLVTGWLQLQREAILANPGNAAAAFDQAQTRLEVISRIHRRLCDPADAQRPLTCYLKGLVNDALQAADAQNIVCVIEVTPIDLALALARKMTLSLLVHELVMNALKHAFRGRPDGIILLKLVREEKTVVLSVHDDGTGFAPYPHGKASLGISIIHSLAAQLGGDVTWECFDGTTVRVAFTL
jgi:two-component sensor histidine kinase